MAGLLEGVTFQYRSTALTMTVIGVPAVAFSGAVFFPAGAVSLPPAFCSGEIKTCKPTVALGFTLIPACVPGVIPLPQPDAQEAVSERPLAALRGTRPPLKTCTPESPAVKV